MDNFSEDFVANSGLPGAGLNIMFTILERILERVMPRAGEQTVQWHRKAHSVEQT